MSQAATNNLDNLIVKITGESKSKADTIVKDAEAAAAKLVADRSDEARARGAKILKSAEEEAVRSKNQIIAGKKLFVRDKLLKGKQDVIDRVFALAAQQLKELPQNEYAAFLERYLLALPLNGDEKVVVPERYKGVSLDAVNEKLKQKTGKGELTLADGEIDGGFILLREGVSNNNTFEALIDYYREELEGAVAENLF